eukprot:COSAG02_NODE_643_length_19037_cov_9.951632_14_plen_61_part_00
MGVFCSQKIERFDATFGEQMSDSGIDGVRHADGLLVGGASIMLISVLRMRNGPAGKLGLD